MKIEYMLHDRVCSLMVQISQAAEVISDLLMAGAVVRSTYIKSKE